MMAQTFELRGVVVSYHLATEEAIYEFPIIHNNNNSTDWLQLVNRLRYHARFDYDRSNYLFMQIALGNVMRNAYLTECLYPTLSIVHRLQQYFQWRKSSEVIQRTQGILYTCIKLHRNIFILF